MVGEPFLKSVATDLVQKAQNNGLSLSDYVVVFPNNRAKLFFNKYLIEAYGKPTWSPSYETISTLFQSLSAYHIADPIKLVCELYHVYIEVLRENPDPDFHEEEETLDNFYNWGLVLLSDFNDIDSNMVDAEMLFQNIKDTIPFEGRYDHLTEEQKDVLKRFFSVFQKGEETELKKRFLRLWSVLGEIYIRFKKKLKENGEMSEGMLKRDVIETLDKSEVSLPNKQYVVVGFNVLLESERLLFKKMSDAKKAIFYWDCDEFYMNNTMQEAGLFMRKNIENFKNELKVNKLLNEKKKITIIESPTENAQAKYVGDFLKNRPQNLKNEETVVVLCNESLLLSVLHSIPSMPNGGADYVNVTMGLNLLQTPIFGLLQILLKYQEKLELMKKANENEEISHSILSTTILPLLRNEYLRKSYPALICEDEKVRKENWRFFKYSDLCTNEEFGRLFQKCEDATCLIAWLQTILGKIARDFGVQEKKWKEEKREETDGTISLYNALYKETLYRIYAGLERISSLIEDGYLKNVQLTMMTQLVNKTISSLAVPFTGDQADGLQVMGFLETRNLDFSNVILLSANEGVLPKSGNENSFIPYSLRVGYGMTTTEHKNSLYAYYFYRLLQRAENVTVMFNGSTDGGSKGQISRFLLQLLVETKYDFSRKLINSDAPTKENYTLQVEKTAEIVKKIKDMYGVVNIPHKEKANPLYDEDSNFKKRTGLSPSAMNTYLNCSLKFYLNYIVGIKKEEEISNTVEANEYGTIFHSTMQSFYEKRKGKILNGNDFPEQKELKIEIEEYVRTAFKKDYFKMKNINDPMPTLSGPQILQYDRVRQMAKKMVDLDKEYAPFKVIANELKVSKEIEVELTDSNLGEQTIKILIGGSIDRIDEKEGIIRIFDYKTGSDKTEGNQVAPFTSISELFIPDSDLNTNNKERYGYAMQVLVYSYIYGTESPNKIKPSLAYVNSAKSNDNICVQRWPTQDEGKAKQTIYLDDPTKYAEIEDGIKTIIRDMLDIQKPFKANKKIGICRYCDFKSYCGVKEEKKR